MTLLASRLETAIAAPLKSELETELQAFFTIDGGNPQNTWFHEFCQAVAYSCAKVVAAQVVAEITAHAVVPAGILGSVTSGAGVGGATITTGTGTVT